MILDNYKNTHILKENDDEFNNYWFDIKAKKVIHNIDTLYVTLDVKEDYNVIAPKRLIPFLDDLKEMRELEDVYIEDYDMYMTALSFNRMYTYCIEKKDQFLVFFAKKQMTENTPPLFIQIRSQALWLYGEHKCLTMIYELLDCFLADFGFTMSNFKENRIDYAYHTNYIKNMTSFFDVNKLNSMQVSHFKQANLVLKLKGDDETKTEYISFGKRTSNNVFVRMYDKTNEVVEQGYKQFFLELWHSVGLINTYDKYIYEKCFLDKSLNKMSKYRFEFYMQYGKDDTFKELIQDFINNYDKMEYDLLTGYAEALTPTPTIIVNVEFQTKRKFYSTFDKEVLNLLQVINECPKELHDVFKLLDNKALIHNLLTTDVFRLVDLNDTKSRKRNKRTSKFWEIIQKCNINNGMGMNDKMLRQYQRKLDIEAIKKRLLNSMSTFSIYLKGDNNSDIIRDSLDFMEYINESDVQKSYDYKKKKAPTLKEKLKSTSNHEFESRYALINKEDGTYIE